VLAGEILRRVREIQVRTGRQVADVLAGEYVSVFRGRGVEFDEVRPYVPGDDVRTLDWKVTARMGEPYVKRYIEERQLTLMLMADVSASQDYGSRERSKREVTAELCALLAFSAIRNDDKVGLTLFHGGIEQYIPPRKGQRHALRVVREVLAHGADTHVAPPPAPRTLSFAGLRHAARRALAQRPPRRGMGGRMRRPRAPREATSIADAMEFLLQVTTRKTICFVVSDFLDDGFERALRTANRKHDVIAVLITDAAERDLPDVGLVSLMDAETGETGLVDTGSREVRAAVRAAAQERVQGLERRLRASGIDFIHIDATGSVVEPLVQFFRMRERRLRR
jgi:uncharacterized protein (DUF58 family)